jgi:hypothetical protein
MCIEEGKRQGGRNRGMESEEEIQRGGLEEEKRGETESRDRV